MTASRLTARPMPSVTLSFGSTGKDVGYARTSVMRRPLIVFLPDIQNKNLTTKARRHEDTKKSQISTGLTRVNGGGYQFGKSPGSPLCQKSGLFFPICFVLLCLRGEPCDFHVDWSRSIATTR